MDIEDKILLELGEIKKSVGHLDGQLELVVAENTSINVRIASHDHRIQLIERVVFGVLLVVALLGATGFLPTLSGVGI